MNCQVCVFVHQTEDSVVRRLSIHDIISANARLPYTNRSAWHAIQSESSYHGATSRSLVLPSRNMSYRSCSSPTREINLKCIVMVYI